jgi:hypothetical protein
MIQQEITNDMLPTTEEVIEDDVIYGEGDHEGQHVEQLVPAIQPFIAPPIIAPPSVETNQKKEKKKRRFLCFSIKRL